MPEGDTIQRIADYLGPKLVGTRLVAARLAGDPTADLAGVRVELIEARGKHLLLRLGNERTLRCHLGMHGSVHEYAHGERWKLPERAASLVLATDAAVYVCFRAEEVELLVSGGAREAKLDRRVGPDLLAPDAPAFDELPARARALLRAEAPAVDVLLDQRVTAGIGNVYKSELLFLESVPPLLPLAELGDDTLVRLYTRGRALLQKNLGSGPRSTRGAREGSRALWVYRREGEACLRCGEPVRRARLGRGLRSTYWCPVCQSP